MNPWTALVSLLDSVIRSTADALGGDLGVGIFVLTLVVRLALIPIMLPLARRGKAWRAVHRSIRPEIKRLNKEYAKDPSALQRELKALHKSHGIGQVDSAGLLGALIQVPVLIAFFQAVIEMSADTPLASGGLLWGLVAGGVSWASTALGDSTTPKPMLYLSAILPVGIAIWLGRGVGLYLVAFYLGSLVQSLLMRRGPVAAAPIEDSPARD
jgi:YidC/Oxa1 family membrane protein insertase